MNAPEPPIETQALADPAAGGSACVFVLDLPQARLASGNAAAAQFWGAASATDLAGLMLDRAMPALSVLAATLGRLPAPSGPIPLIFWTPAGVERQLCRFSTNGQPAGLVQIEFTSPEHVDPVQPLIVPAVAAKISHEVRTPLTSILGFAEIMRQQRFGPIGHPKYVEYAADIEDSARHALSLVNDLMELSRTTAASVPMRFVEVDANEVANQCLASMRPIAERAGIALSGQLTAGLPHLIVDRRAVRQILLNLLSNAIKFTGLGGQVCLTTSIVAGGAVRLSVRDTGAGMAPEEIARAFQPFRQVAPERRKGDGAGLGLPITRSLAEANGGKLSIDSKPGAGTTVTVEFPADRAKPV